MPRGAQAHHVLVDGIHMGKYFAELQTLLDYPEKTLA